MDTTILQPAPASVSFSSGFVNKSETNLTIQCHDRNFKHVSVLDDDDQEVFTLQTARFLTSWSVRRSLTDAAGTHILDLRHYHSNLNKWIIEDPQGKRLSLVKGGVDPVQRFTTMEAEVVADQDSAVVSVRSFDRSGTRTVFQVGGATIAEMVMTDNNDLTFLKLRGVMRTAWTLRVAPGVDVAMVLALAFCRAEISHMWRR